MEGAADGRRGGQAAGTGLRVASDRRVRLEFTSDAGLLAFRELDDALGLTGLAADLLRDNRTGKNGRHGLLAQFRQAVFGRVAGYEDVNDADRLGRDPAMRGLVGGRAVLDHAASTSQMGRFETDAMTTADNVTALADSGRIRWLWRGRESEEETLRGGKSLDQLLDGDWASPSMDIGNNTRSPNVRGPLAAQSTMSPRQNP